MKCGRNVQVDAGRALLLSRLTAVLGLELRLLALQPFINLFCVLNLTKPLHLSALTNLVGTVTVNVRFLHQRERYAMVQFAKLRDLSVAARLLPAKLRKTSTTISTHGK